MSYLANAIQGLLGDKKMTAADLARAAELTEAQISRLRTATKVRASDEDLIAIAKGFGGSAKTHAQLLYARLNDDLSGPGAQFISITLKLSIPNKTAQAVPPSRPLPPGLQSDIDTIIQQLPDNRTAREMVHSIARLCRGESLTPA